MVGGGSGGVEGGDNKFHIRHINNGNKKAYISCCANNINKSYRARGSLCVMWRYTTIVISFKRLK